jgi:hypothetical protein
MPYSPIRAPEKHVSEEDMWAKLAKRTKPLVSINPPQAAQTPKAELRVLEWLKPVRTGEGTATVKTACGRFRIDRVTSQASVGYTCWQMRPGHLNERLGCADDPDKAKRLCEAAA